MVSEQHRMLVDIDKLSEKTLDKASMDTFNQSTYVGSADKVTGMELSIATETICDLSSNTNDES